MIYDNSTAITQCAVGSRRGKQTNVIQGPEACHECGQNHSDPQSRREREVFPINVAGSAEYQYGKK